MVLRLRIENLSQLPDGGPIEYESNQHGFDFGRGRYLDWVLPDPDRWISEKHCEVRYYDGAYWLNDPSTNGTFLDGTDRRLKCPYRLRDGDVLVIGKYLVSVSITGESQPVATEDEVPTHRPVAQEAKNIWQSDEDAAPPISREELVIKRRGSNADPDFLDHVADVPNIVDTPRQGEGSGHHNARADSSPDWNGEQGQKQWTDTNHWEERQNPPQNRPPQTTTPAPTPSDQPVDSPHRNGTDQSSVQDQERPLVQISDVFIKNFCRGAGLPESALMDRDPAEVSEEIGVLLRITVENLMQLLSARNAAKTMVRSSERTKIEAVDNNPLKFSASVTEALKEMFDSNSRNYLGGQETLINTFEDLKSHQINTYSAMQYSIQYLVDRLSPEAIESESGKGNVVLGTRKSKLWETYESRWNSEIANYENGLAGVFMLRFGEWYDKNSKRP